MLSYLKVVLAAFLLAINYYVFIVPNHFAPAGLNGIATMIQYKTGFSISYMSLLINIPLCALTFGFVDKAFAVKTLVFTVVYSLSYLFLQGGHFAYIQYDAKGQDTIYPVIISGVLSGLVYGIALKNHASTGGTDLVSKYIGKVNPDINFFYCNFVLNATVAFASLFVYSEGRINYKPVALCITYCFISSFVGNYMLKSTKSAYKFTVITRYPDEIAKEITQTLRHSATKISGIGTYTNQQISVLICVVNKQQIADFQKVIYRFKDTFSFCESVNETYGNFKHIKKSRYAKRNRRMICHAAK